MTTIILLLVLGWVIPSLVCILYNFTEYKEFQIWSLIPVVNFFTGYYCFVGWSDEFDNLWGRLLFMFLAVIYIFVVTIGCLVVIAMN